MAADNHQEKIRAIAIIEVLGKPKEHVEEALRNYVKAIREDGDYELLKEDFSDAIQKEEFWSVFVELEMKAKDIMSMVNFCFDYMPSSIDILEPRNITLKDTDMSAFFNDLQARLHEIDMRLKKHVNHNEFLQHNLSLAVRNSIVLALAKSPKSLQELSKFTGIKEADTEKFISKMTEEKKIEKQGESYVLVRHG